MDAKYGDVVGEAEALAYLQNLETNPDAKAQPPRRPRGRRIRRRARDSRHDHRRRRNKVGFDFVYGTGYWMTASAFGLPDAGHRELHADARPHGDAVPDQSTPRVIADADTGYGGLLNVHHTVRGYEEAGVVAIQIEDQEFPKKCGHTPFKRVVPIEDMVEKIKVACEARRSPRLLIIARTDARQTDGFEGRSARHRLWRGRRRRRVPRGAARARRRCARPAPHRQADDGQHGRWRQDADPLARPSWPRSATAGDLSLATGLAAAAAAVNALTCSRPKARPIRRTCRCSTSPSSTR